MKTLYITRGNNILIDTDNNTANKVETSRQGIDTIIVAKEPMHIVYGNGSYNKEFDAETGDIIVTFYPKEFKNQALVIKNEEWLENIQSYEKEVQAEKERWAAAKNDELTADSKG